MDYITVGPIEQIFTDPDGTIWVSITRISAEGSYYSSSREVMIINPGTIRRLYPPSDFVQNGAEDFARFPDAVRVFMGDGVHIKLGLRNRVKNGVRAASVLDDEGHAAGEIAEYRYNIKLPNGNMLFDAKELLSPPAISARLDGMVGRTGGEIVKYVSRFYEGKLADYNEARRSLVWPEATNEILALPAGDLERAIRAEEGAIMRRLYRALDFFGVFFPISQHFGVFEAGVALV